MRELSDDDALWIGQGVPLMDSRNAETIALVRAGYRAAQAAMPPRELTQAMLDAGSLVFVRKRQDYIPKWEPSIAGDFWRAMYDAWAQEQTMRRPRTLGAARMVGATT